MKNTTLRNMIQILWFDAMAQGLQSQLPISVRFDHGTVSKFSLLLQITFMIAIVSILFWVSYALVQGSPTPRSWTDAGPWPVRNRAAQQEVSTMQASKASSVSTAAPHRSHYRLSSSSSQHYGELYIYFIIYYNVIIIEIKGTINVMCLNHPETIPPPWSVEKLSSTKPVPGAKKVGDCCISHSL